MVFIVKPPFSFPTNERSERVSLAPATRRPLAKSRGFFMGNNYCNLKFYLYNILSC